MRFYESLAPSYELFSGGSPTCTAAEVFPEASAVLLAERFHSAEETKVCFRRRVPRQEGVDETVLPTIDWVDAALAALTVVRALEGSFSCLGDPAEGVIIVPVATLPASRLVRARSPKERTRLPKPIPSAPGSPRKCGCDCGAQVRRRFLPGHDAKLKARLVHELEAGDGRAGRRLAELGWL